MIRQAHQPTALWATSSGITLRHAQGAPAEGAEAPLTLEFCTIYVTTGITRGCAFEYVTQAVMAWYKQAIMRIELLLIVVRLFTRRFDAFVVGSAYILSSIVIKYEINVLLCAFFFFL